MAQFLTTHSTAAYIEDIIRKASTNLVLVSPYLQLSVAFFERLLDADRKGVNTTIVYRTDQLKSDEKKKLGQLVHLSTYNCDNLHAKCYFNDDTMVITSMNMYEFSEKHNREIGILITKENDPVLFNESSSEIDSIIGISKKSFAKPIKAKMRAPRNRPTSPKSRSFIEKVSDVLSPMLEGKDSAFCIRCGKKVSFDTKQPLCDKCFNKWTEFENPNYPEKYCHKCGKRKKVTYARPRCPSCYSK